MPARTSGASTSSVSSWRGTALDLQYVGSHTSHLDRSFFNNTPQPGAGQRSMRAGRASASAAAASSPNDLIADYDAVSIILRKRMSHGLQADVHYTWSRTRDMATHSNGGGQTMDNYDIQRDYGPANWDIPHRFVASYLYDVPFLKNSSQPVLKYVVAGWQISGVTTIQSGIAGQHHVLRRTGRTSASRGSSGRTWSARCPSSIASRTRRHDRPGAPGADQLLRRERVCAAGAVHVRQRRTQHPAGARSREHRPVVHEELPVGGSVRFQVRVEIYNVFNTVNYDNPNASFGSASFGRITGAGSMRQMQLGGKMLF